MVTGGDIMEMRTGLPAWDNLYYITGSRGWNPCILGNPSNRPYEDSVLANCIGAAVGRFNELADRGCCDFLGNAYPGYMLTLAKAQGLEIWDKPAIGGTIVMVKANGVDGHVISVERIRGGYIDTFESGWSYQPGTYFTNRTVTKGRNYGMGSEYKFSGCIVNPAVVPYPFTMKYVNKWHRWGEGVKAVQWALNLAKCYEEGADNSIDGSCGPATQQAIRNYQATHTDVDGNPLEVDGSAGPATQGSMKRLYSIE